MAAAPGWDCSPHPSPSAWSVEHASESSLREPALHCSRVLAVVSWNSGVDVVTTFWPQPLGEDSTATKAFVYNKTSGMTHFLWSLLISDVVTSVAGG